MNAKTAPTATLAVLRHHGITHVIGIPDNTSAPLYDALGPDTRPRRIIVTREGEAFALAAGLWLGGAKPLVVIQNCGLLEAGDALRGTAVRMAAPIPFVVTGRGYAKMRAAHLGPSVPRTRELLARSDVDSAALLTEPTLDAWGIPWSRCEGDDDPSDALGGLLRAAEEQDRPVALVLAKELT